jgi:hypothetical protein
MARRLGVAAGEKQIPFGDDKQRCEKQVLRRAQDRLFGFAPRMTISKKQMRGSLHSPVRLAFGSLRVSVGMTEISGANPTSQKRDVGT